MDLANELPGAAVVRTLEHELSLVQSAVLMVSSGGAPRVSLVSLRFAEQLLHQARRMALRAGVRIVPLWTLDDGLTGLAVEGIADV
jgi:hypothetical protein